MKKNKNECKKLMSCSVLLLGLFSFLLTTSMPVNAEVATLKTTLAQITVTGKVTDSRNTPLDGISVAVKGAKTAVITDAKGMFTISVPDNGTLVFSAVGFISEEVAVKNNKVINVFLTEQVSSLSDAYERASLSISGLTSTSQEGESFGEQMQKVSTNLAALNNVYELQLQGSSAHLEATQGFQKQVADMMQNLSASVEDTKLYRENMAMLAQNLTDLNNVYGNMLKAMKS
jgi:hypothetical protein